MSDLETIASSIESPARAVYSEHEIYEGKDGKPRIRITVWFADHSGTVAVFVVGSDGLPYFETGADFE